MANEQNLKSIGERPTSEQREIQSKGGKASGAARRRRKSLQETARMVAKLPLNDLGIAKIKRSGVDVSQIDESDMIALTAIVLGMVRAAANGDAKAARVVAEWLDMASKNKKTALELEKLKAEIEEIKRRGAPSGDVAFLEAWKQSIIDGYMTKKQNNDVNMGDKPRKALK